jgi:hypothetical protein
MRKGLDHALAARRRSRSVELRRTFDPRSDEDWLGIVRDLVAIANSGGGVILLGESAGAVTVQDFNVRLTEQTDGRLPELELVRADRDGDSMLALIIGEPATPIVFADGTLFFRHGAKTEPATTADLAAAIERRMHALHKIWLTTATGAGRSTMAVLPAEIRDSTSPEAMPIRIVDDPHAATVRLIDYDRTHPYRQKELLAGLRERLPGTPLNQFDLLSIRHVHGTDEKPEFSHQPMFGSRQYSERFLEWLIGQANRDPEFFAAARAEYMRTRRGS